MTKFNADGKEVPTFGDCLRPAMAITDEADAAQYLAAYVAHIQAALEKSPRDDGLSAEQIAKINIGYFAGYYDHETRQRVERLFACTHPIFGSAAANVPTPQQAFEAGRLLGTAIQGSA